MHCSWQIARHNPSHSPGRQPQITDLPWPGWLEHDDVLKAHPELLSSSSNHSESKNENFVDDPFALRAWEYQWTHIQPWLESKGYMIRPRFRPGWIPSWTSTSNPRKARRPKGRCEDAVVHSESYGCKVMDAIRITDGRRVMLKRVPLPNKSKELEVNTFLSSDDLLHDPCNHALPLLDTLRTTDSLFMVFPLYLELTAPEFDTVGEGVDFMEQTLEGLAFLHQVGVAHRDCSTSNIVMDPGDMYPRGFHADGYYDAQGRPFSGTRTRTQVGGVRYYFIDFGESIKFDIYGPKGTKTIKVISKACIHAPETSMRPIQPYDAFKPDLYTLGKVFEEHLIEPFAGDFEAFKPLIRRMSHTNPKKRPSAAQALERIQQIKTPLPSIALHGRLHPRNNPEGVVTAALRDKWHLTKQVTYALRTRKW